jgi:hypothetical protein
MSDLGLATRRLLRVRRRRFRWNVRNRELEDAKIGHHEQVRAALLEDVYLFDEL